MSVIASELKLYDSLNNPDDESSTVGGGINVASEISGGSIGELMYSQSANPEGGSDKVHYQKCFYKNTNSSTDLTSAKIWILNSLDNVPSNGTVTVVSDSASDTSPKFARIIGRDASSVAQLEDLTLNGLTPVTGTAVFSEIFRVEIRSGSALALAVGNITITRSSALGIVPAGYYSATGELKIGLAAALSDTDTTTTTNSITAPGGISFSKPNTSGEAIAVVNSGSLSFGLAQGIWVEQTIKAGTLASPDIDFALRLYGTTV